jgi:hypothetical protein
MQKVGRRGVKRKRSSRRIAQVGITSDCLTSRAGLSLFMRYVDKAGVIRALEHQFGNIRKRRHGAPVASIFKQLFCFLADGTSRSMVHFDRLADDEGYAATIEAAGEMLSSHQVKRFFAALPAESAARFRSFLRSLAIRRMQIARPEVVVLGLDSMVMDNNEARKREGADPTYKKVRGFHPLQLTWDRLIVDADFRSGSVHCNRGDGAFQMVDTMVAAMRAAGITAPVIVRLDAGFCDHELMNQLDAAGIGYLGGGTHVAAIGERMAVLPPSFWHCYENGNNLWRFADVLLQRKNWKDFRRTIYSRTEARNGQYELALDETTESVFYTNLGRKNAITEQLIAAGQQAYFDAATLMRIYHGRGNDELVHRHLKEFSCEQLPFKRFSMNRAFYYVLLLAFMLYESFKEDVCQGLVSVTAYPTTLRRKVFDIAAKIVRSGNAVVLKVTQATWNQLGFETLWRRANAPPVLCPG